jgi:prepilin peptidase dependent protein C
MHCYQDKERGVSFGSGNGFRHKVTRCSRSDMGGLTTARWESQKTANHRQNQQGFSLAETLVAMLLLALTISTLLNYHRALALGFSQQWQQRQAWQVASQALLGREVEGWQIQRQQHSMALGCVLEHVTVSGTQQRTASLARLNCHSGRLHDRHPRRYRVE